MGACPLDVERAALTAEVLLEEAKHPLGTVFEAVGLHQGRREGRVQVFDPRMPKVELRRGLVSEQAILALLNDPVGGKRSLT